MRHRWRWLLLIWTVIPTSGCISTYASDPTMAMQPGRYLQNQPESFFSSEFPLSQELARAQAPEPVPDRIEPISEGTDGTPQLFPPTANTDATIIFPQAPPKRSLRQRLAKFLGFAQPDTGHDTARVTSLPQGTLQTPPVASAQPIIPTNVPPPTAEQVNAIPLELIAPYLKETTTDVAPVNFAMLAPTPAMPAPQVVHAPEQQKTTKLAGQTFVRDAEGSRVILRFTDNELHLQVLFLTTQADTNKPTINKATFVAEYAFTTSGMLVGVVVEELHLVADDNVEPTRDGLIDEPFSIRYRLTENGFSIQSFRGLEILFDDLGLVNRRQAFSGRFVTCDDVSKLGPIKPLARPFKGKNEHLLSPPRYKPLLPPPASPDHRLLPTTVDDNPPRLPPPPQADQSTQEKQVQDPDGISMAFQLFHTILQENPLIVQSIATEAGRGLGQWLGKQVDQPELGMTLGGILGSSFGRKLTQPTHKQPTTVSQYTYWLGLN